MRKIASLAWLNALQMLRNPAEMVGVIVLPLLLTMLFGAAFSGADPEPLTVLFVDEDGSDYSAQVGALIDAEESLEIETSSREDAERAIAAGDAGVAVLVPEGFGEGLQALDAEIEVMRSPTSQSGYAVLAVVQGIAMRMSGNAGSAAFTVQTVRETGMPFSQDFHEYYAAADARWEPTPPVYVAGETVVASEVRGDSVLPEGNTQSSVGFTVWFILFMTFGSAGGILEEREQGTLRRLMVAPIGRSTILAGKVLGTVLAAAVQAAILVLVGALAFGVPWGHDPLAVVLVLGAYILAGTGLAVMISALVRTRDQMSGLAPIITTGLAMLGGCLWPIEVVPQFMQLIAKLTPTGWAVLGLTDVVARNQGLSAAVVPTFVLLGFAAVTLAVGVKMLKFE